MVNYLQEDINYNTKLVQAFHNTIDIPPKYLPYIFEENTNGDIETPELQIKVSLFLDQDQFIVSKYRTITDFEIAFKIKLIQLLKEHEGFMIDFYETDIEKELFNEFSPLIRNIRLEKPTLFIVNNPTVIYEGIEAELDFQDVLDFVPPYFYYDYNNINLVIQM